MTRDVAADKIGGEIDACMDEIGNTQDKIDALADVRGYIDTLTAQFRVSLIAQQQARIKELEARLDNA